MRRAVDRRTHFPLADAELRAHTAAPTPWVSRQFTFDRPLASFPDVLARLASAPDRVRLIGDHLSDAVLGRQVGQRWSAKQHVGHLADLTELDCVRLKEFCNGAESLTPADMTNAATEAANHNDKRWSELVAQLWEERFPFLSEIDGLSTSQLSRTAMHPRLGRPMRMLDWLWWLSEHDDHHIASAKWAASQAAM